jgi:hypothetical protein
LKKSADDVIKDTQIGCRPLRRFNLYSFTPPTPFLYDCVSASFSNKISCITIISVQKKMLSGTFHMYMAGNFLVVERLTTIMYESQERLKTVLYVALSSNSNKKNLIEEIKFDVCLCKA